MLQQRTIWILAGACVLAALLIAAGRVIVDGREARQEQSRHALLDTALDLLQADPGADKPETQRALRRAAVTVEDAGPQNAEGLYLLAQQYLREVDYNRAEELFRKAIDARPGWSKPHAALGRLLSRNAVGRRDEAQKELEAAIALEPDWWDPYDSLAILHRLEGELHAAHDSATKAVALAPQLVGPRNNLANLLVTMKRYDEAEKEYRAAIALDDGHAKPYYNLACLYAITHDTGKALEYLDAAISRSPSLRLQALSDADFRSLRKNESFKQLVAQPPDEQEDGEGG